MKLAESPLLKPYVGMPAILDSNLLLLLWCFEFDPALVTRFKRLNTFALEDVRLLLQMLSLFSVLRTTPHVLTEVSNLANSLAAYRKADWSRHFSTKVQNIPEEWMPATGIVSHPLSWLGITDAALACLAATHVVVTIDFPLTNALESSGLQVINFTRFRDFPDG